MSLADTAPTKRYLHGDVTLPAEGRRFRLKVVNPSRRDRERIRCCCKMANRVHAGLQRNRSYLPLGIPQVILLDEVLRSDLYLVELIPGHRISCGTADERQMIVEALLDLEEATQRWGLQSNPAWINHWPPEEYRKRVAHSLSGAPCLHDSERKSLIAAALSAFERGWNSAVQRDVVQCFVHGDFSKGNTLVREGGLTLIDFEHSHIGAPGLDLAHLYVNLRFVECNEKAADLRDRYLNSRASRLGVRADSGEGLLDALVIERITGKWNAMSPERTHSHEKMRALLFELIDRR